MLVFKNKEMSVCILVLLKRRTETQLTKLDDLGCKTCSLAKTDSEIKNSRREIKSQKVRLCIANEVAKLV